MIEKFTAVKKEMAAAGFWSDFLSLDRVMIECHTCPTCWRSLDYKGYANSSTYRAYGVCVKCDYAKKFWTETSQFVAAKKHLLQETAVN